VGTSRFAKPPLPLQDRRSGWLVLDIHRNIPALEKTWSSNVRGDIHDDISGQKKNPNAPMPAEVLQDISEDACGFTPQDRY
jgi:hypothetical protein